MSTNKPGLVDYGKTHGVTIELQKDIIQFLSSKHTSNATLSVEEIMQLYDCPQDRAKRVIAALERDDMIEHVGGGKYRVTV
jgi:hypothetical protein